MASNELLLNVLVAWRGSHDNDSSFENDNTSALEAIAAVKFQEQVLRLTLLGWHNAGAESCIEEPLPRTSSLIASFVTESTSVGRTCSAFSETDSFAGSTSLDGDRTSRHSKDTPAPLLSRVRFLGAVAPWNLSRVGNCFGKRRRVGIDLGGVIFTGKASKWVSKALEGVRSLVAIFGIENVFIVSRVVLDGAMHDACYRELTRAGGFLEKSGILLENVVFVPDIDGPYGKGVIASHLGLTHFVDDKYDVLRAVYADKCGNSGDLVREFKGRLFHFEYGGRGQTRPCCPANASADFKDHYRAVSGWPDLVACFEKRILSKDSQASPKFVASAVAVHRVAVGLEQDNAFNVADRLLGQVREIEDFTGVKVLLRGRGSPQPQSKRDELDSLSLVIRTKPNGSGDLPRAISLVEDLLQDVLAQHREYRASCQRAR